jgi:hypothetical protein
VSPAGRCSSKLGHAAVLWADRTEAGKNQDVLENNPFARIAPDSASIARTKPAMSEVGPVLAHPAKSSSLSHRIKSWCSASFASSLSLLTLPQADRLNAVELQLAEMRRSIGYDWSLI